MPIFLVAAWSSVITGCRRSAAGCVNDQPAGRITPSAPVPVRSRISPPSPSPISTVSRTRCFGLRFVTVIRAVLAASAAVPESAPPNTSTDPPLAKSGPIWMAPTFVSAGTPSLIAASASAARPAASITSCGAKDVSSRHQTSFCTAPGWPSYAPVVCSGAVIVGVMAPVPGSGIVTSTVWSSPAWKDPLSTTDDVVRAGPARSFR